MCDSYVGEIRIFAGTYSPTGWHFCDGTLLAVNEYQPLFSLIGYTYGGSGSNFALPDLRTRLPMGQGQGTGLSARVVGQNGGNGEASVGIQHMPNHSHALMASPSQASTSTPSPTVVLAAPPDTPGDKFYFLRTETPALISTLSPETIASSGGDGSHGNVMPCVGINFIISLNGIYPSGS